MGAFQEERQVLIASPFCKFAHGIESVQRIPYYVEMATRNAIYGRPGATYLDVPDDIITGKCDVDKVHHHDHDDDERAEAMPAARRVPLLSKHTPPMLFAHFVDDALLRQSHEFGKRSIRPERAAGEARARKSHS